MEVTCRDRRVRNALDQLGIAERYTREAREVMATADSYDDRQRAAVLLTCVVCGLTRYFTAPKARPMCAMCVHKAWLKAGQRVSQCKACVIERNRQRTRCR